ncbi:photosystem reaction center subunit H [cyanobacterium TDX16]|nr:photosystem reaction center subunit H [cyanobacterium TDX16]
MTLVKIEDFEPNYRDHFDGKDIKGMSVYLDNGNEKIGTVSDVLVDEEGNFRYFGVDIGSWIFGKKVLMPVGRSRIDYKAERIYAVGMTKQQAEALPKMPDDLQHLDYDYEEQVREVYRTSSGAATTGAAVAQSAPTYNRDSYQYKQEPSLYEMNDRDRQDIKLYQERLIASKKRVKTGEVSVGKHVETETKQVSVPIDRERVVVERVTPADAGKAVAPGSVNFGSGEVARMEIYEETADIHKEAFVREEVRVNKVIDRETVEAQETIRREEIDINSEGRTIDDRTGKLPSDR